MQKGKYQGKQGCLQGRRWYDFREAGSRVTPGAVTEKMSGTNFRIHRNKLHLLSTNLVE